MVPVLTVVSFLLAMAGGMTLTPATMGVGMIAGACYLGILARMSQAAAHRQADQVERLPGGLYGPPPVPRHRGQ